MAIWVILFIFIGSASACHEVGISGVFDFYALTEIWPPTACQQINSSSLCSFPNDFIRSNFLIHNLSPSYYYNNYSRNSPECCLSPWGGPWPPLSNSTVQEWLPQLLHWWPDLHVANDLWSRMWEKHGTCSGLAQSDYIGLSIAMAKSIPTPTYFATILGKSNVSLQKLYDSFNSTMVTIGCNHLNQLTSLITCWSRKNLLIPCPPQIPKCPLKIIDVPTFNRI